MAAILPIQIATVIVFSEAKHEVSKFSQKKARLKGGGGLYSSQILGGEEEI